MSSSAVEDLEQETLTLEQEVARGQAALEHLETALRAMAVEARAAVDPRQFRAALLSQRRRPGVVAGAVGFVVGLGSGTCLAAFVGWWLGR